MAGHKLPQTNETICADSNFATWLDGMLYSHHLTKKKFAEKVGCERKLVQAITHGDRSPRLDFVVRCCAFFGLKAVYIPFDKKIFGEDNDEDSM